MLQKSFTLANYFFEVFSNSHITKQQDIKGGIMKISPALQRGIKAAEVATIETAKGLVGYAVTKDPLMTATVGKLAGDAVEIVVRAGTSIAMVKSNKLLHAVKLFDGNPANLVSDALEFGMFAGYTKSFREGLKLFVDMAKDMWKTPY